MKPVAETTQIHTRLLKCALEVEDARAYFQHADGTHAVTPQQAFSEYWFGARSLPRVEVLLTNFRARFDAFPPALQVLHRWPDLAPDTRRILCHFHMQLSDPLYRAFTGDFLVARQDSARAEITRDLVVRWVAEQGPGRWTMTTRIQFASKLLSTALAAGLLASNRDPRRIVTPRVDDDALEYLLYLLRGVAFAGTLVLNPYLQSVGLSGGILEDRLRVLPSMRFRRQGDLHEFGFLYPSLSTWAEARFALAGPTEGTAADSGEGPKVGAQQ